MSTTPTFEELKSNVRSWPDLIGRRLVLRGKNTNFLDSELQEYYLANVYQKEGEEMLGQLVSTDSSARWYPLRQFQIVAVIRYPEMLARAQKLATLMGGNGLSTTEAIERMAELLEIWQREDSA